MENTGKITLENITIQSEKPASTPVQPTLSKADIQLEMFNLNDWVKTQRDQLLKGVLKPSKKLHAAFYTVQLQIQILKLNVELLKTNDLTLLEQRIINLEMTRE